MQSQGNNKTNSIDCPRFEFYHFLMLEKNELTKDERKEIKDHIKECRACTNFRQEIKVTMRGENRPSRQESLAFLSLLCNAAWTMELDNITERVKRHMHKDLKIMSYLLKRVEKDTKKAEQQT